MRARRLLQDLEDPRAGARTRRRQQTDEGAAEERHGDGEGEDQAVDLHRLGSRDVLAQLQHPFAAHGPLDGSVGQQNAGGAAGCTQDHALGELLA